MVKGKLSLEEGVRVGDASSDEDLVIVKFEVIVEGKHEALLLLLCPAALIVICDCLSSRMPVLSALPRSCIGLHSSLKERVQFLETIDMQGYSALAFIPHAEVEPLPMPTGV